MPSTAAVPGRLARRTLLRAGLAGGLAGLAALTVSGCRLRVGSPSRDRTGDGSSGPSSGPDPNQSALQAAATSAQELQRLYGAAALVRPDLAAALARLGADHAAHVRALAAVGASAAASSGTATTGPTGTAPSPSSGPGAGTEPTAATALSLLAQREQAEANARLAGLGALDGRTARLMASLGACSSAHLVLLARLPAKAAA